MPQAIVELSTFQASDAFLEDPQLVKPAISIISWADGCLSAYHGFQAEDKRSVYLAVVWRTPSDQAEFKSGPNHGAFLASLSPVQQPGSALEALHVDFTGSQPDLKAHIRSLFEGGAATEMAVCRLRKGAVLPAPTPAKDTVEGRASRLSAIVDGLLGPPRDDGRMDGMPRGQSRFEPLLPSTYSTKADVEVPKRMCYFAVGWDNERASSELTKAGAGAGREGGSGFVLPRFDDIVELSIVSVVYEKYVL